MVLTQWSISGAMRADDGRNGLEIPDMAELAALLATPADERGMLLRHLRAHHPNLIGAGNRVRIGFTPLPDTLSRVPLEWLLAVHEANHAGLYVEHADDDWLCRHLRDETEELPEA